MPTVSTASRIAAWYHNDRFWVALRAIRTGQPLEVFSSTDGRYWNYYGSPGYMQWDQQWLLVMMAPGQVY